MCHYQSERHCTKTSTGSEQNQYSVITSQNVTAPKRKAAATLVAYGVITSQNVTAPKLVLPRFFFIFCVITSQNVTAPKPTLEPEKWLERVITSQNVTAPKPQETLLVKRPVSLPVRTSLHQNQLSMQPHIEYVSLPVSEYCAPSVAPVSRFPYRPRA